MRSNRNTEGEKHKLKKNRLFVLTHDVGCFQNNGGLYEDAIYFAKKKTNERGSITSESRQR